MDPSFVGLLLPPATANKTVRCLLLGRRARATDGRIAGRVHQFQFDQQRKVIGRDVRMWTAQHFVLA